MLRASFAAILMSLVASHLGAAAALAATSDASGGPNIVVIMADDIGLGDIGSFHQTQSGSPPIAPTPNIDALASEGLWFTDAHSPTALCSPSRYAVMSGNNPFRSYAPWGVWRSFREPPFKQSDATLGTVARKGGCTTGFIGKWHLGGDFRSKQSERIYRGNDRGDSPIGVDARTWVGGGPQSWGFDYDFTLPCGVQGPFYVAFENAQWYPLGDDSQLIHLNDETALDKSFVSDKGFGTGDSNWDPTKINQLLAQKATHFIRDAAGGPGFFLCYWTPAVHIPHSPPERLDDELIAGQTPSRHLDMIRVLDWEVGQIVEALKESGEYEDTLLIFTSDNGGLDVASSRQAGHDASGGWRGHKNDPYEGGHRVPFIAVWPNVISGPEQCDALVSGTDVVATIAAARDVTLDDGQAVDSWNLLPLLKGDAGFEGREELLLQGGNRHEIIYRQGNWKLIIQSDAALTQWDPMALYDLENNPHELKDANLLEYPEHAGRVKAMLERCRELRGASEPPASPTQTSYLDDSRSNAAVLK